MWKQKNVKVLSLPEMISCVVAQGCDCMARAYMSTMLFSLNLRCENLYERKLEKPGSRQWIPLSLLDCFLSCGALVSVLVSGSFQQIKPSLCRHCYYASSPGEGFINPWINIWRGRQNLITSKTFFYNKDLKLMIFWNLLKVDLSRKWRVVTQSKN